MSLNFRMYMLGKSRNSAFSICIFVLILAFLSLSEQASIFILDICYHRLHSYHILSEMEVILAKRAHQLSNSAQFLSPSLCYRYRNSCVLCGDKCISLFHLIALLGQYFFFKVYSHLKAGVLALSFFC